MFDTTFIFLSNMKLISTQITWIDTTVAAISNKEIHKNKICTGICTSVKILATTNPIVENTVPTNIQNAKNLIKIITTCAKVPKNSAGLSLYFVV